MKEMKCLDCEKKFKAESSDGMMQAMMPHYKEDHAEMMASGTEESRKEWFERFGQEWEGASEVS